jgi:hypothetical protein
MIIRNIIQTCLMSSSKERLSLRERPDLECSDRTFVLRQDSMRSFSFFRL